MMLKAGIFALALLTAGVGMCQAAGERELLLCDFEQSAGGLNLGSEFPGAKGDFQIVKEAAHDGSMGGRLTFDLTKGAYVGWFYDLPLALPEGTRAISVWVRPDQDGRRIHCKTRDQTGQEHQRYASQPLPGNQWTHLTFPVEKMQGHWNGANDGKIHWPITLIQFGVEPGSGIRQGHVDLDNLTVTTTASRQELPGTALSFSMPHFGNLFAAKEQPSCKVSVSTIEQEGAQQLEGGYQIFDWQEHPVTSGKLQLSVVPGKTLAQSVKLPRLPSGAYRLVLTMKNAAEPAEVLSGSTWFGVLQGPNPKPCSWVGSGLHSGHGWGRGDLRFLDILNAAGIGVVRDEFGWGGIEREKGQYAVDKKVETFVNALKQKGIRLNLILDYGNGIYDNPLDPDAFARWCGWMAKHFNGRISNFEIWNEPGNFQFLKYYGGQRWGNAPWIGKFVELSRKASAAVKAARPDATVSVCAEDCWPTLEQMVKEGIGPAGDVISLHPYCHGQPRPEREFFLKDGGRELRAVSKANGGPRRVTITEAGWTTYEGPGEYLAIAGGYPRSSYVHQAQYMVRMYLTAFAAGADYAIQYDFKNDGPRRGYTEHNFGLVHEDYSPKPSLMAVAAMTRLVGQGRFVRDAAPDPSTARAYVIDVAGKPIVAAYAIEGETTLALPVGKEKVEIADLMGNRKPLATPGGIARLKLTETPIYILGAQASALSHFVRVETADTAFTVTAGDTVQTTLRFVNHSGKGLRPQVRCQAPAGTQASARWAKGTAPVIANGGSLTVPVTIRVSPTAQQPFAVKLQGSLGNQPFEQRLQITPQAPVSIRLGTATQEAGAWRGEVRFVNTCKRALPLEAALYAPGATSEPLHMSLAPGKTASLPFTVVRWPDDALPAAVQVRAGAWQTRQEGVIFPATVPKLPAAPKVDGDLSDWQASCRLPLSQATQFARLTEDWRGPTDLSADVRLAWCAEGLCLGIAARDDVYYQPSTGGNFWDGDSVQLALTPVGADSKVSVRFLALGLAHLLAGDRVFPETRLASQSVEDANPVRFAARKNGESLTYEALIPWQQLPGMTARAGASVAFSLLVNDNDGKGRRGWMEAFGGIGWTKDTELFGRMRLED